MPGRPGPLTLTVLDKQAGGLTTVTLADLAQDISRYEVLGDGGDSGGIASPRRKAPRAATMPLT